MTFPASFSPLAGKAPAAFGAPEPSDSFALPGPKAAEAAGASSVMATVGPPLVAQAAAGQLVGQRVLNALIDLGLEKLVILVGPGVGYITGGLSALLGELAFPQSTANADHLAALMSALAAEGVTFNGRVAWETLPDGRRMMVSADDPNLIIAIVREDGTLFINPIFLPGGGRAGSGDGVTPETLMASPVGSAVPSHTGDVSIYVPDYSVIERRMRAAGREHATPLSVIAGLRESVTTFNQGARPGDRIELMLPVKTAAGETVFLLLEGRTGAMRAEIEELWRAGFFPDDTRSIEDIISAAALLSGLTGELRAIVAGGRNVIPGPLDGSREELPQAGPQGNPSIPMLEGFPETAEGVDTYTDTANRNPPAPPAATEPGPQIPPVFNPNLEGVPLGGSENALPDARSETPQLRPMAGGRDSVNMARASSEMHEEAQGLLRSAREAMDNLDPTLSDEEMDLIIERGVVADQIAHTLATRPEDVIAIRDAETGRILGLGSMTRDGGIVTADSMISFTDRGGIAPQALAAMFDMSSAGILRLRSMNTALDDYYTLLGGQVISRPEGGLTVFEWRTRPSRRSETAEEEASRSGIGTDGVGVLTSVAASTAGGEITSLAEMQAYLYETHGLHMTDTLSGLTIPVLEQQLSRRDAQETLALLNELLPILAELPPGVLNGLAIDVNMPNPDNGVLGLTLEDSGTIFLAGLQMFQENAHHFGENVHWRDVVRHTFFHELGHAIAFTTDAVEDLRDGLIPVAQIAAPYGLQQHEGAFELSDLLSRLFPGVEEAQALRLLAQNYELRLHPGDARAAEEAGYYVPDSPLEALSEQTLTVEVFRRPPYAVEEVGGSVLSPYAGLDRVEFSCETIAFCLTGAPILPRPGEERPFVTINPSYDILPHWELLAERAVESAAETEAPPRPAWPPEFVPDDAP